MWESLFDELSNQSIELDSAISSGGAAERPNDCKDVDVFYGFVENDHLLRSYLFNLGLSVLNKVGVNYSH